MNEKKETLRMSPQERESVIFKDRKKFRLKKITEMKNGHIKDVIYEEFDEKKFNQKVKKIVNYILSKTNLKIEDVLTEILKTTSIDDLDKIEKKVDRKLRPSLYGGCLCVRIGNAEIPIVS